MNYRGPRDQEFKSIGEYFTAKISRKLFQHFSQSLAVLLQDLDLTGHQDCLHLCNPDIVGLQRFQIEIVRAASKVIAEDRDILNMVLNQTYCGVCNLSLRASGCQGAADEDNPTGYKLRRGQ